MYLVYRLIEAVEPVCRQLRVLLHVRVRTEATNSQSRTQSTSIVATVRLRWEPQDRDLSRSGEIMEDEVLREAPTRKGVMTPL